MHALGIAAIVLGALLLGVAVAGHLIGRGDDVEVAASDSMPPALRPEDQSLRDGPSP